MNVPLQYNFKQLNFFNLQVVIGFQSDGTPIFASIVDLLSNPDVKATIIAVIADALKVEVEVSRGYYVNDPSYLNMTISLGEHVVTTISEQI